MRLLTGHRGGHGSALDAGAERPRPFAGECLHSDVVGGVRLQTLDAHVCFSGAVGAVVLTVDVSIHHGVLDNLPVPLGQKRGAPGQVGGGGGQARHTQVLGVAAGNIFGGADLLHIHLPVACSVSGAEFEDVGGSLMEASNSEVIVCMSEVFAKENFFFHSLVLQLVSKVLPHHFLGGLPLDQGSVSNSGADQHSWLTRN